jgi:hypothetical protein
MASKGFYGVTGLPPATARAPLGDQAGAFVEFLVRAGRDEVVQGQFERRGYGGDGEKGRGRDPAGLDLAEGVDGDPAARGDVDHGPVAARHAQQLTEPAATFTIRTGQRRSNHERDNSTGITITRG